MQKALVVLGALAVVLAIVVPATASRARDITSRDIDDNTIRSEDIHQGAIEMGDLSDGLKDRLRDRVTVVSMEQDFGPNGIGGAWCDDPDMLAISGGAELSSADVANDVAVRSSWPYVADPANPSDRNGWKVQLNAPPNVDPGTVTVYAVCAKVK
jgi:hypothetical protein